MAGRITEKSARVPEVRATGEGSTFELDYTDLTLGLVLMVVIPSLCALSLGLADMPLSGNTESKRAAVAREVDAQRIPVITRQEFDNRMERIAHLIENNVKLFRAMHADDFNDRGAQDNWFKCTTSCLDAAEEDLKQLEAALQDPTAKDLLPHMAAIRFRLDSIQQIRGDLNKDRPFY